MDICINIWKFVDRASSRKKDMSNLKNVKFKKKTKKQLIGGIEPGTFSLLNKYFIHYTNWSSHIKNII